MDKDKQENGHAPNHARGVFAGLLMGGLAGAGAMLLWAPQSGKKLRARIRHQGLELRHQVTETADDALAQARDQAHRVAFRVHKQTRKLQRRGEDLLDEQKEVVSQVVEAEKKAVHNLTNG